MTQRETIAELKNLITRATLLIEDIERDDARLSREDYAAGRSKFYIGQIVKCAAVPEVWIGNGSDNRKVTTARILGHSGLPDHQWVLDWIGIPMHAKESEIEALPSEPQVNVAAVPDSTEIQLLRQGDVVTIRGAEYEVRSTSPYQSDGFTLYLKRS